MTKHGLRFIGSLPLAILLLLAGLSPAFGQQTVTAEGTGEVAGEDREAARNRAIEGALRNAVEQAVATLASAEAVEQNLQILQDRVYVQSQGYIQNYRILSETPEPGAHRVTLQAAVAVAELRKHLESLGVLRPPTVKPTVTVFVAEQNIDRNEYDFSWRKGTEEAPPGIAENAILEKFRERGFQTVDRPVRTQDLQISPSLRVAELNDAAAAAAAKQMGAEVVIVGKVLAKASGTIGITSMKSAQASITLRAIQTEDTRVLSSGFGSAAAVHIEELAAGAEAIRKAGGRVAEKLTEDILRNFQRAPASPAVLQLTVFGLTGAEDLRKFKTAVLGQIQGLEEVHEREFSESKVKMDVKMKGNAHSLSRELSRRKFPEFALKVLRSTADTLDLEVLPR